MMESLSTSGGLAATELMMRFAGGRQRVLAHNIANLSTPGFQPKDVSVEGFRASLRAALDERGGRGGRGALEIDNGEVVASLSPSGVGRMRLEPGTARGNILFHDRNNRDLERSMQSLAENAGMYRVAAELWRKQSGMLKAAISERV